MVRDFYLPDAILSVVFDPLTHEYRMILLSGCTSMCVCMKCKLSTAVVVASPYSRNLVPPSFFNSSDMQSPASTNEYPAFFVKIGWDTTTFIERPIRFTSLLLAGENGKSTSLPLTMK
jgi:hypothetical protein